MSIEAKGAAAHEPHVLTTDDLYALCTYDFTVVNGPGGQPCVFKLRRMDLLTRMMEDAISQPLLKAAMAVIEDVRTWLQKNSDQTFESAFQHLDTEKRATVLEHLRQYAVKSVLRPKLTLDVAAEPDAFPVQLLTADILFGIWNYTPPNPAIPRLTEAAAENFRAAAGAPAAGAPSTGDGVSPAAVDVDPSA